MRRSTQNSGKVQRRAAIGFIALMALLLPASPATATLSNCESVIVLDGATSAEGIAAGEGDTFYAGDLALGDIYRGDIRKGDAELFIDVSDFVSAPRNAVGMKADVRNDLLFVAGGPGHAYVYNTETAKPVADVVLTTSPASFINDVTLTRNGAWFTSSAAPELYFIPVGTTGELGAVETLPLSGPAADITGAFNLNGIASANDSRTLIVAHSGKGELYTVNPATGESALIEGVSVENVDGIVVQDDQLWAVQNFSNQISRIELSDDLSSGELEDVITSKDFNVPATAALFGDTLAAVNAQFMHPEDTRFEVVLVPARS
ncbi:sugar lactone lactonase YvrE [Arthrobacter pascens]|uniref:SMP-30/gluconolactonase/LRE family protein n=1 Tax=Arthrobacter pascens TaxID=1677 RepID=UPI00278EAC26|nr:hypothetical protein [Arthrobacter pascens]MDQ0676815.1 sugar lactone lactonase YvrE [Arthrobacter pascens]